MFSLIAPDNCILIIDHLSHTTPKCKCVFKIVLENHFFLVNYISAFCQAAQCATSNIASIHIGHDNTYALFPKMSWKVIFSLNRYTMSAHSPGNPSFVFKILPKNKRFAELKNALYYFVIYFHSNGHMITNKPITELILSIIFKKAFL